LDLCFSSSNAREIDSVFYGKIGLIFWGKLLYFFCIFLNYSLAFMRNVYFDLIVSAILKYKHKLVTIDTIRRIFAVVMQDDYTDKKMYKLLYYLKNR
jgi:hypothetical protein